MLYEIFALPDGSSHISLIHSHINKFADFRILSVPAYIVHTETPFANLSPSTHAIRIEIFLTFLPQIDTDGIDGFEYASVT